MSVRHGALPEQTGAEILTPGPRDHDGLSFEAQDPVESQKTLALVNAMKDDLSNAEGFSRRMQNSPAPGTRICSGLARPGSARPTRSRVISYSTRGRFDEGNYAGWFGWPNLTMKPAGGFLGMPASDQTVGMRVVDIYRRAGDRLAENWIFIDILHFLKQTGLDVLERNREIQRQG